MTTSSLITSTSKTETVNTTCCYCGVGCGVTATLEDNKLTAVTGQKDHPANLGRLCVKGSSLDETQDFSDRLHTPMVNGEATDWDTALTTGAAKFKQVIEEHGPDAVAFYLSGQLLTEDYYIANKFMKGFVGTANVDTNSRLCMASAVVAHKRAFGEDLVPGCYEDLETTDLLFLVGSNMAYTHPVVYQRIDAAKKQRPHMKIVVLDPRRTPTCDIADIHLPLKPGSDAFFFNGLLSYLDTNGGLDKNFIAQHCQNFTETLNAARAQVSNTAQAALMCDVDESALAQVYKLFSRTEKAVTVFSQGINQSSSGVDKGNAIINCHLASGKIGKPGAAPFSITGQPNAMGGREAGGLANQLAAHMNFGDEVALDKVKRFWQAPNMVDKEGLKAVDMFQAVHDGKIKAIWIMATNPVVTMPNANLIRDALRKCELVIVSDCVGTTDTAQEADIIFPATTWGEKTGTVTNSERCMSLQKGLLPAPGEAKNDWEIIKLFAQKMGFDTGFNYNTVADIFREHAALSGFENNGDRAFDISALENISDEQFLNFEPTYWPIKRDTNEQVKRLFTDGRFYTANGRANFLPVTARFPARAPADNQLVMNTGRIRDQWHTMGRTGSSAKLVNHTDEPYMDIHPQDAAKLQLIEGELAVLQSQNARFVARVQLNKGIRPGSTFVPMHWNSRFSSHGRADALVNSITDPLCGQPEFKHTPVTATPYQAKWQGYLLSHKDHSPNCDYWVKIPLDNGYKFRLADNKTIENWQAWLRQQFADVEYWSEMLDSENQFYKATGYIADKLAVSLSISNANILQTENTWLESQLGATSEASDRFAILAGAAPDGTQDPGKIICSCYQIGENDIKAAIADGVNSADALGEKLKCGTNCGSCVPELNNLINEFDLAVEALSC